MFGSDDSPLQESIADMYFARGAINGKRDDSFVRGRVAMLIWLPSLIALLLLSVWLQNVIPVALGIPGLVIGLGLYMWGPEKTAAFVRKRIGPNP
jgi:hypothetical protein